MKKLVIKKPKRKIGRPRNPNKKKKETRPTIVLKLQKNSKLFIRFTGLTPDKFADLVSKLKPLYKKNEERRLKKVNRQRAIGGGTQFKLKIEDRLLMLLLYYRTYITHEFLGLMFGLHNSNVSRIIKHLNPLLSQIFRVPEKRIKLTEQEARQTKYFFIDGTEQPIQRPKNYKKQKEYYSGKKKDIR